jgi:signal transduction histidine kinase
MLQSLRTRLALSHALPVLLFVALLGLAFLYQLERRYFLEALATELAAQGTIIASFTRDQVAIWDNPFLAQLVLEELSSRVSAQMMLVNRGGQAVAANWFDGAEQVGKIVDSPAVASALNGQLAWTIDPGYAAGEQLLDVAVPVTLPLGRVIGVVRLSHSLEEVQRRLAPLRTLLWLMLGAGAALSLLLGLFLAQWVAAPLRHLADAVTAFTPLTQPEPVPMRGPSEVQMLATAFNRMSRRLADLERSRQALLTGIVHELGRPLGAIKAAAQTIRNSTDHELAIELAAGINDQVDELKLQIDDLTLLGEVELEGLRVQLGPVDIAELLQHQTRQFASFAADRGIVLTCSAAPGLPLITADAKRVAQIVGNLIHNALKYTPRGGQVQVTARLTGMVDAPRLCVDVTDTGPGIALEEQERIFELFYRSPAQQRLHQGVGIGLFLARYLAERHQGTLTVASRPGHGSTFTLSLPLYPPTP